MKTLLKPQSVRPATSLRTCARRKSLPILTNLYEFKLSQKSMPTVIRNVLPERQQNDIAHTIERRRIPDGGVIGVTLGSAIVFCLLLFFTFRRCVAKETKAAKNPAVKSSNPSGQAGKQIQRPYPETSLVPYPFHLQATVQQELLDNISSPTGPGGIRVEGNSAPVQTSSLVAASQNPTLDPDPEPLSSTSSPAIEAPNTSTASSGPGDSQLPTSISIARDGAVTITWGADAPEGGFQTVRSRLQEVAHMLDAAERERSGVREVTFVGNESPEWSGSASPLPPPYAPI